MFFKKLFCAFCMVFCGFARLHGQVVSADTVMQLPEFETNTSRFKQFTVGVKSTITDSLTKHILQQQNLAQLLAYSSPLNIKVYGQGQLATTGFRGAGAQHTAVLWNGINLQNSMNGQTDFSMFPVDFADEVELYYGGNTSLYGSGAVGGAVVLNNLQAYNQKGVGYSFNSGSFGLMQHQFRVQYGTPKWYAKAKAFHTKAENNFTYKNNQLAGAPLQPLTHAQTQANGLLFETGWKPTAKQTLDVRYWYQYSNRNLPPTIGMAASTAAQLDKSNKLALEWRKLRLNSQLVARAAWFNEYIHYSDSITQIFETSKANALIAEAEFFKKWQKPVWLNVGFNNSYTKANNRSYTTNPIRNSTAAFASLQVKWFKKLTSTANFRQEFVAKKLLPFTASLSFLYVVTNRIDITFHINKSYRLPTFNELYWLTGNPNLLHEQGYGQEVGIKHTITKNIFFNQVTLNVFNRNINNWIVWQPEGGSWTPQNLTHVWSRGAEFKISHKQILRKVMITWNSEFSYVLSSNQQSVIANDESLGKQLIYVPKLSHQHWLKCNYKSTYVALNLVYSGYRFITSDNTAFLNHYSLLNAFAGTQFQFKKYTLYTQFQVGNVLNNHYQVVAARPMPLRNVAFCIGLKM